MKPGPGAASGVPPWWGRAEPVLALFAVGSSVAGAVVGVGLAVDNSAVWVVVGANVLAALALTSFVSFIGGNRAMRRLETDLTASLETPLRPHQVATVCEAMGSAKRELAVRLGHGEPTIRANIFRPCDDGLLRIAGRLRVNMDRPEEWTIAIRPGEGSTGKCFLSNVPYVSIFGDVQQDSTIKSETERRKAHPGLKWIVSLPVFVPNEAGSEKIVWVLNFDGFTAETKERLEDQVPELLYWASFVSLIVAEATQAASGPREAGTAT